MEKKMERKRFKLIFENIVFTIFFVFIAIIAISITAKSHENKVTYKEEQLTAAMEKTMVREVREYLSEEGYENSGVMLNKVYDEDYCVYTLSVHNKKIADLSDDNRQKLIEGLSGFAFEELGCDFEYKFIF
ncbi:MAG: hypothetical protein J6033_02785 [Lachnospiraceae bacterium]|nr:hypothetical protein [Lachnospiraceae bacterium]